MSQKIALGPCGFSLAEIIAMADRFAMQAATFGFTDPHLLNEFCQGLGAALTKEFTLSGMADDPEEYTHRIVRVVPTFTDMCIQTGFWSECAKLGPYDGPLPKYDRHLDGAQTFFHSFCDMREILGVSASDLLDLLAWIQIALSVRLHYAQRPHLATSCDPKSVPMHS